MSIFFLDWISISLVLCCIIRVTRQKIETKPTAVGGNFPWIKFSPLMYILNEYLYVDHVGVIIYHFCGHMWTIEGIHMCKFLYNFSFSVQHVNRLELPKKTAWHIITVTTNIYTNAGTLYISFLLKHCCCSSSLKVKDQT